MIVAFNIVFKLCKKMQYTVKSPAILKRTFNDLYQTNVISPYSKITKLFFELNKKNFEKYKTSFHNIRKQGRFQSFGQGGANWRGKRAKNIWHPPVHFWLPHAVQGGC